MRQNGRRKKGIASKRKKKKGRETDKWGHQTKTEEEKRGSHQKGRKKREEKQTDRCAQTEEGKRGSPEEEKEKRNRQIGVPKRKNKEEKKRGNETNK